MALIDCPECGRQISSAAAVCINCGHPMGPVAAVRVSSAAASSHACPKCGSEFVKKLSIIHAGGLSDVATKTSGLGMSLSGAVGLGSATTVGQHQTKLSRESAPPQKRHGLPWAALCLVFSFVAGTSGATGWAVFFFVIGASLIAWVVPFNMNEYPKLFALWNLKFLCERCGNVFALAS